MADELQVQIKARIDVDSAEAKGKLDKLSSKPIIVPATVKLNTSEYDNFVGKVKSSASQMSAAIQAIANGATTLNSKLAIMGNNLQTTTMKANNLMSQLNAQSSQQSKQSAENIRNALRKVTQQMDEMKATAKDGKVLDPQEIEAYKVSLSELTNALAQGRMEYGQFNSSLSQSKGLDQLNTRCQKAIATFQQMQREWTKFAKNPDMMSKAKGFVDTMGSSEATADSKKEALSQFNALRQQAQALGMDRMTVFDQLKANSAKFISWLGPSSVIMGATRQLKQLGQAVIDVNKSMTTLKKVSNETGQTYDEFLSNATNKARELSTPLTDVIDSTSTFSRLGYALKDAEKLGQTANIMNNVGDLGGIDDASQSLVSIMKAYGIVADEALSVSDTINVIDNNFAVTAKDAASAMRSIGAAMSSSNNSFEQSIALWTAMNEVIQDGDVSATALKFITQRMRNTAGQLEAMGEDADGAATSVTKLQQQIRGLTGVDIMADAENFRSTYDVLSDISKVWDDITDKDRADVVRLLAGTRQASTFGALMKNFQTARDVMDQTSDGKANGSSMTEYEKWQQSVEAKQKRLQATQQKLAVNLIDDSVITGALSGADAILNTLADIAGILGSLPSLAALATTALTTLAPNLGISM